MLVNGRWVTPPLACLGRALALQSGQLVEAVVRVGELDRVQGWARPAAATHLAVWMTAFDDQASASPV